MSSGAVLQARDWAAPSLWLAIGAALVHAVAGAAAPLELDRTALAAGEWWRLLSGHFVHWTTAQLFWDGVVFAALGGLCWREDPRLFWRTVLGSAAAVSAAVLLLQPEIHHYRGLSGIDAGLFAALGVRSARALWRERRFHALAGLLLAAGSLAAKIAWEATTRTAFFAGDLGPDVIPLPLAHAVGAGVGAVLAALPVATRASAPARPRPRRRIPSRPRALRPRS